MTWWLVVLLVVMVGVIGLVGYAAAVVGGQCDARMGYDEGDYGE
jgi:hypothetical protein